MALEALPPHAPELNPLEELWCWLKYEQLANFAPRFGQILMDVGGKRLQGGDVNDPGFFRQLMLQTLAEQVVQSMQKGGKGLSRPGRRRNQGIFTGTNSGPALGLGWGRLANVLSEPAGYGGVE